MFQIVENNCISLQDVVAWYGYICYVHQGKYPPKLATPTSLLNVLLLLPNLIPFERERKKTKCIPAQSLVCP